MTAVGHALLAGRYRLATRIATGGMGEVWRACDLLLERPVAVKLLKREHVDDEDFRARFRAEARHAAGLSHPGIASVYDYGEQEDADGRSAWLVMELVEGEPLSDVLRRGPLPVAVALDVVGQVGLALAAAHDAGVVHRDVKPGNLLLRPDGVVKVTDFGIAYAADAVPLTRTGMVVGTAYYLSPEQALGATVTAATDVYSLGVVAYECLTGVRPFAGDSALAVAGAHLREQAPPLPDGVPEPVRGLVLAALGKEPGERPASAGAFGRDALALRQALLEGAPLPSPSSSAATRPHPGLVRPRPDSGSPHRRGLALAGALVAVVLLAIGGRVFLSRDPATVPAVAVGTEVTAATSALRDAGLRVSQRHEPSTQTPSERVVRTEPAAGAVLRAGDVVVLVLSSGPAPTRVDASRYAGRPWPTVRQDLTALGLLPLAAFDGRTGSAGTVDDIEPQGTLAPGTRVVVHVVPAASSRTPSPALTSGSGSTAAPPAGAAAGATRAATATRTRTSAPTSKTDKAAKTAPSGRQHGKHGGKGGKR